MILKCLITVVGVLYLLQQTNAACADNSDCSSCANDKSWTGFSCRWCPVTNQCHSYGSLANSCSVTQNIVDPQECGFVQEDYSVSTAKKMALLSAVAYSDDASSYITKALPNEMFQQVLQVTKDCSWNAKCSGFAAVSHVDKIIVVVFRGSETTQQVIDQVLRTLTEAKIDFPAGGHVQSYFYDAFNLIWPSLKSHTYSLINWNPDYRVLVTGHSLGGALASIGSTIIVHDSVASSTQTVLYTFGQPRVGSYDYAKTHDELVKASWRVVHYRDIVPQLPPCYVTLGACLGYGKAPYHHGTEIFYPQREMSTNSEYTKCLGLPHNEGIGCSYSLDILGCSTEMSYCIDDHKNYFGINIGDWWMTA